ncbi:MAG: DUF2079 domain-containing protein [Chloroflexota bacterium]
MFGGFALLRHWTFHSTAFDLAIFDQVIWNTVHGRFMESTISLAQCTSHSFFGDHFSPALLGIVPFYLLYPHAETLIVMQTVALALGGWPVYLLARRYLPASEERLVWVAAYVLSAPLAFITLYDFHEITFAVWPIGLAVYFLATRRTWPMLVCLALAYLVKEEVAVIAVGFALALLLQRRWRVGTALGLTSLVVFFATLRVVIPAFAGAPYFYVDRYAILGTDEADIVHTLLLDPLRVIRALLSGEVGSKLAFVLSLIGPGLGLALRSKWAIALTLPTLAYLLLSNYPGFHTLHNQYGAPLIPIAIGASILGLVTVQRADWRRRLSLGVLLASILFAFVLGAIPFTPGFYDAYLRGVRDRAPAADSPFVREVRYEPFLLAVRSIPADAKVSSRDFFTTQLPQRRFDYSLIGLDVCDAEYVILDFAAPSVNRDMAKHLAEVAAIKALGFDELASGEGLSLLKRR